MARPSNSSSKRLSHLRKIARKGGEAGKGAAKARTPEQARAAVKVRWDKWKAEHQPPPESPPAEPES